MATKNFTRIIYPVCLMILIVNSLSAQYTRILETDEDISSRQLNFSKENRDSIGQPYNAPLTKVDGKLWGVTHKGGYYGRGTVYTIDEDGSNYQSLYQFDSLRAWGPRGNLIEIDSFVYALTYGRDLIDPDGSHYYEEANLIRVKKNGSKIENLGEFGWLSEQVNGKALLEDSKLWFCVNGMGGMIYSYDLKFETFQLEYNFEEGRIMGGLIKVGSEYWGVRHGDGYVPNTWEIFAFDPENKTVRRVFHFDEEEKGRELHGELLKIGDLIYGVGRSGGTHNHGVIYSMRSDGSEFKVLHHLQSTEDSPTYSPRGGLVYYNGFLWGTGDKYLGYDSRRLLTIFKLALDGSDFSTQASIEYIPPFILEGSEYFSALTLDENKLWGTSPFGGDGFGFVYYYDIEQTELVIAHKFIDEKWEKPLFIIGGPEEEIDIDDEIDEEEPINLSLDNPFLKGNRLEIYPNPFNNSIKVLPAESRFWINNVSGQLVTSGISNGQDIDLSNISSGIYVIKVQSKDAFVSKRLFKE